jgi:hypothetical protein
MAPRYYLAPPAPPSAGPSPEQRDKAAPLGEGVKPVYRAGNCRFLKDPASLSRWGDPPPPLAPWVLADSSEEEDDWEAHVEHGVITQEAPGLGVVHAGTPPATSVRDATPAVATAAIAATDAATAAATAAVTAADASTAAATAGVRAAVTATTA